MRPTLHTNILDAINSFISKNIDTLLHFSFFNLKMLVQCYVMRIILKNWIQIEYDLLLAPPNI